MLAPSNVWLNFSSCIVSGASGVKVPPAIKGSPCFRYLRFSYRWLAIKAERYLKSDFWSHPYKAYSSFDQIFFQIKERECTSSSTYRYKVRERLGRCCHTSRRLLNESRGVCTENTIKNLSIETRSSYILTANQQAVQSTWPGRAVLQKFFDPGRRSSIEFHEMKQPLHAWLRPFRKLPNERIRGTAWPSCSQHVPLRNFFPRIVYVFMCIHKKIG